ncbi:MAG: nucleotidyltransferase domain-containing protein [Nitrospira sp.]|nr:nucleotidyltransferase domain-containing protein [Nitrospira sp.]
MRLDENEKKALKHALKDFRGEVYLFGSRTDDSKRGGDIDILLVPKKRTSPLTLTLDVQKKFFFQCEEDIDVVIYQNSPFCREILKRAKRIDNELPRSRAARYRKLGLLSFRLDRNLSEKGFPTRFACGNDVKKLPRSRASKNSLIKLIQRF